MTPQDQDALAAWLADRSGAGSVVITDLRKLSGGAIQENWLISAVADGGSLDGPVDLVLRTDAPSAVVQSLGRAEEFTVLGLAGKAGMTVPEPLYVDPDGSVLGKPAYVMRRVTGTANPRQLTRDTALDPHRSALARQFGREIAKLHRVTPPREGLAFLGDPPASPAKKRIAGLLEQLDRLPAPLPILEWGIRWLSRNVPVSGRVALCHGDYRIGNIMIDGAELTGFLDWEFASWSDPMEDIGWLCARCWRFGADAREAGGFGERADLYQGYEAEAGHTIDWSSIAYWEVMATVRWAIIAHHQGLRHVSGAEFSIELALTGRKAAEMELDVLTQIRRIEEAR